METFLAALFSNPLILGAVLNLLVKYLQPLLAKMDQSGSFEYTYSSQIHTAYLVVAFLASVLLAMSNHALGGLDLNSLVGFLQTYIPVLIGGKAMETKVTPLPKKDK
jgi:hypothetical protein